MSAIVRHSTSVPVAADFASTDGTPFIINTATGLVYVLTDAGVVTAVGSGVGSEPSNGDKGDITVTAAGLTWTIDAGAVTLAKLDGGVTAVALGGAAASHGHAESDVTGLVADLSAKQATLVSGTNIKTINGASVLGSGDLGTVINPYAPGSLTVPTENYVLMTNHLKLTTTQRASLAGTARLRIT